MAPNKVLVAVLFLIAVGGVLASPLCKIDTTDLGVCRPAVTTPEHGQPLPLPTEGCCAVVRRADLKCLCNLKSMLPAIGIDAANAMALPGKCGLSIPPECHL